MSTASSLPTSTQSLHFHTMNKPMLLHIILIMLLYPIYYFSKTLGVLYVFIVCLPVTFIAASRAPSPLPTSKKRLDFRSVVYSFALQVLPMPLVACVIYPYSPTLAVLCTLVLCLSPPQDHRIPALRSDPPPPCPNVQLTLSPSGKYAKIEIGGSKHSNNWKEEFQRSFLRPLKTTSLLYHTRHFKADVLVRHDSQVPAPLLAKEFRCVMDMLSLQRRTFSPRTPSLELNVTVSKHGSAKETLRLQVPRLVNLEQLTWKGIPPTFPVDDGSWQHQTPVFPRLNDLSLIDCDLSPQGLVEVLVQCPTLHSCDVDQLPPVDDSKNVRFSGSSAYKRYRYASPPPPPPPPPPPASSSSTFTVVPFASLKHLRIASSFSLKDFFDRVQLPNIRSISLHVSRSSPVEGPMHEYIPLLNLPWPSIYNVDLRANMDYYSLGLLKTFFAQEPALYGRTLSLCRDSQ